MRDRRTHPRGRRAVRALAIVSLIALLAAACSNSNKSAGSSGGGGSGNNQPGVTKDTIRVGGVASVTNPLSYNYGEAFQGTKAYFAMINSQGGIYGRKLQLVATEDDQLAQNQQTVQKLITEDNVFAVAPVASLLFTGAKLLAQSGVPAFGWNINPEWAAGPNLFGDKGSNLGLNQPNVGVSWMAKTLGKKRVAVLGYNISESSSCGKEVEASLKKYKVADVVYDNVNVPYPINPTNIVATMKQNKADFIVPCLDTNGVVTLAKEMKTQGLNATLSLPDGYYNQIKGTYGDLFQGSYASIYFTPFELKDRPKALNEYLNWLNKEHGTMSELSLAGWVAADMLYTGLKAAGPNFTRAKVVNALNSMKDYTANGILPGIDWTIAHTSKWTPRCSAVVQIQNHQFVPVFTQPGKPFICFPPGVPATLPEPTHQ